MTQPGPQRWRENEISLLKKNYPLLPWQELMNLLGRSASAIQGRAQRLGLHRELRRGGNHKFPLWTDDETALLQKWYRDTPISTLSFWLGKPKGAIIHKANDLKLIRSLRTGIQFEDVKLSQSELAYIAGLIDGDGTVTLILHGKVAYDPMLYICNTSLRLMNWLKSKFPTRNTFYCYHPAGPERKQGTTWWRKKNVYLFTVQGYKQYPLFRQLKELLIIKRPQMKILLKYVESRLSKPRGTQMSDDEESLIRGLKELNSRGIKYRDPKQLVRQHKESAMNSGFSSS